MPCSFFLLINVDIQILQHVCHKSKFTAQKKKKGDSMKLLYELYLSYTDLFICDTALS